MISGCKIKNGTGGIHLTMSREGRPSGEAYVEFETEEDTTKGLAKDNEHLGSRYIEGTIYFLMSYVYKSFYRICISAK